ncbi:MAG: ABC transporter ATP-binding protein [Alphaproteobacteria bacterium]
MTEAAVSEKIPVVRTVNLTRILPGVIPTTLVESIDLEIYRGEFVAITGPSGSGKSSLLYLLGLLDAPTSGRIVLDGVDVANLPEDTLAGIRLQKLGFVFQFHFLLVEFTALENVMLPMQRLGALPPDAQRQRAEKLLCDLGLEGHMHKRPDQVSGGQRQRIAIARALANDPLIILADEPTGNLDTKSSANVREILGNLARNAGKTIIAVTHEPDFAAAADRRVHLVDGRISS